MDPAELQRLIVTGENVLTVKYFSQATFALVVWDHLITIPDEVEYVWKREKSWAFWLFIVCRYSILICKTWLTAASFLSGDTQEFQGFKRSNAEREPRCDHTVKLEGYYFVFVLALGLIFLSMRIYALTEASKYVIITFGILVTSSLVTGLWFKSAPSAKAMQMPKIPLDPFRACILIAPQSNEWAYRAQVALADIIAFVCLVVFIFKLKAEQGQSRMTRVMRSILQDGILYFLIMTAFHITMLFFTVIRKSSAYPPIMIMCLIPMMVSRLVVSLRKTVNASTIQVWDGDHFTAAETDMYETMTFAGPSSSQVPHRDPKRSPTSSDSLDPCSEV